jgi:hypothetical protein
MWTGLRAVPAATSSAHVNLTVPSPRHHIPLLEARAFQCRFIVSEDTREAVCCGAPTSGTSSWCEWHRQLVYVRPHGQERKAA